MGWVVLAPMRCSTHWRARAWVRTLAEPNLTVISGQPASFLVGGQFPVPVPGGALGQTTIDYKNYGVSLNFLPTVFSDGRISIHVAPEVSQLSSANAGGGFHQRIDDRRPLLDRTAGGNHGRARQRPELRDRRLLQDSVTGNRSNLPYLGDIPILGPAFRDDQFQRGETEIVILVHALYHPPGQRSVGLAGAGRQHAIKRSRPACCICGRPATAAIGPWFRPPALPATSCNEAEIAHSSHAASAACDGDDAGRVRA